MNITSLTKGIYGSKKALQLIAPVVAAFMGTLTPAFSASTSDLVTNAGGTIDDSNPVCAVDIRVNCGKRMPFMQKAWDMDKLDKISQGQSNGDTGDGQGRNNGAGRNGVTGASNSGAGTGSSASGNQSNIKKSRLTSDGDAQEVLAYDIMVKPFGQPGHYLPGAAPEHQPQYATYGDYLVQYAQTKMIAHDKPKTMRDLELFQNALTTFGLPCSDTQFQMIDRENNQRLMELACDPERFMWAATTQGQLQSASAANVLAGSSEAAFRQATARIVQADGNGGGGAGGGAGGSGGAQVGALINIANEQSGVPTTANNPNKTVPQAVWMVQQMYKFVFVPLAILFLLPGAVMTQVKSQIVQGFRINAEDQSSPFEGILRSVIAIFLIPATQLIVSYSIDVGNSMAYSVKDWVDLQLIFDWSRELTYNTPINNVNNGIMPPSGQGQGQGANGQAGGQQGGGGIFGGVSSFLGGIPFVGGYLQNGFNSLAGLLGMTGEGLGSDVPEQKTIAENQTWLSSAMEMMFNMATYIFSSAIIVLGAYQLIFVCYLFLLGPLAAAFFAWPRIQAQGSQKLFADVFSNWVNAVIVVSLWRFYWMVILAIMTQRILYIQDSGGASNLQWEVAVFTCLLGLMMWVPFNPWSFDPAVAFETANAAGQKLMGGASQAMGGAAQAGGMPAGQVQAMQGQINQALQPMQSVAQQWSLASNGPSGTASNIYQGQGALAGSQPSGGNTGGFENASANTSVPPMAQPQSFAAASPNVSAPGNGGNEGSPAAPPTTGDNASANMAVASSYVPNTPIGSTGDMANSLTPDGASLNVNGNASPDQVASAMPETQATMASLGMPSGGDGAAIPSSGNGGGTSDSGGGSSNLVAMNTPTSSASGDLGSGPPSSGGGSSGGSGDSQIQAATLASLSGGGNPGGGRGNPTGDTDTKGKNDDTPPPPTAYA